MESFFRDLKFGAKLLLKERSFAATAILTLALCIGANITIFTVVNSVLFRPLPAPESERILLMYNSYPKAGVERGMTSAPDYYDRLRGVKVFEEQALFDFSGQNVGDGGTPQRVEAGSVTPSFFRLLRARPHLGRTFLEEEGEIGDESKVVLSFSLWQQLYGGNKNAVGRDLRLNGRPYTVVGVMPPQFLFLNPDVKVWIPLAFTAERKSQYHSNNWTYIGRLKAGTTLEQAQAQVDALNAANLERFPQWKEILINAGFHTRVVALQDEVVREVKGTLYLLWGGVFFVLVIGCVNIANLALARSAVRLKELTTRFALGAGPWRVTRQLLTESVLLSVVGGALGFLLGYLGLRMLTVLAVEQIPRGREIAIDATVVLFSVVLTVGVAIAIGLFPIAHSLHLNTSSVLREEARTGTSRRMRAVRRVLVTAQVAFAFVLLVGAGLLLMSFRRVLSVDPGFRPNSVLTASVSLPTARYPGPPEVRNFVRQALEKIRSIPAVSEAGVTRSIPLGGGASDSVILAEGYVMKPGESLISPSESVVSPGYFEAMGIRLIRGRFFEERDNEKAPRAIIIDERLARRFWPAGDPIGKRMFQPQNPDALLKIDENTQWLTVVGVVREVKLRDLVAGDERVGAYYFPHAQRPWRAVTFAVHTAGDPQKVVGTMRAELAEIDPELPLYDIKTMDERLSESLIMRRSPMLLAIAFGVIALFLSAIGIYGVLAYLVTQRSREIGIRVALGSTRQGIFELVLKEGVRLIVVGLLLGLTGALGLREAIKSQLFGIHPTDPTVLLFVTAILGSVALIACLLPAHRATRVDPTLVLHEQ